MSSIPINKDEIAPQEIKTLSLADATSLSEWELPVLPVEVLRQTLDQLDNVVDLANVAMVCREWRELINSCDACWEKSFYRDYNHYNAEDYAKLPTWRQRYIACALDKICLELRNARHAVGALAEEIEYLERSVMMKQDALGMKETENSGEKNSHVVINKSIARDKRAMEEYRQICDKHVYACVKLAVKRKSLQAATEYKPKINPDEHESRF